MEEICWTDLVKYEDLLHLSHEGEECPTYSKKEEGYLDWSRLA